MKKDICSSRENARLALLEKVGLASRLNQAASDRFDEAIGQFLATNRTDGRCLDIIDRLGPVSAGQLANESGLTTGAITAVIDRLERAGYVQRVRDRVDRRKVWVECTPAMRTMIAQIFGYYDVIGLAMTRRFSSEQLSGILAFLNIGSLVQAEMAAGLREHMPDPSTATVDDRVAMTRAFRRAMEALAPRLATEIDALAPRPPE
jgi:DNA-binding MarR family transcriptional regulator